MKFQTALKKGLLVKRYKRFFADIETDQQSLTIHVPNTGSLKEVIYKDSQGQKILFTPSQDPARKLKGTLEAVQTPEGAWVGVNTGWPNKVVAELIKEHITENKKIFKQWSNFSFFKSEAKISKETRLDGMLYNNESDLQQKDFTSNKTLKHFIEIKNTTMSRVINGKRHAQFPDGVTERGVKHLETLVDLIDKGHTAEIIFAVQRNDCDVFSIAEDLDPAYGKAFKKAVKAGVVVTPLLIKMNDDEIYASTKTLPLVET